MARIEGLTMTRGNRGLLFVALTAGLIAAVLVFAALNQVNDSTTTSTSAPGGTVSTVVAAKDIEAGNRISADMLKVVAFPEDLSAPDALGDMQLAVDEVARVDISEGEALTPSKFGDPVDAQGIGPLLDLGWRAMAIRVDEGTAVGGNLLPGDRVDVYAVFEDGFTTTVLQDREVLSVGVDAQEPLPVGDGTGDSVTSGQVPSDFKENPGAATLTLEITPDEALKLALVQEQASKVYAVQRPLGDKEDTGGQIDISAVRP
jgi:pilus assembly protein CpaB